MSDERPPGDESPKERADRDLIKLLNELSVVLPGVTVLFGSRSVLVRTTAPGGA